MMLQVSVTACEMVAEAGSGGSLYTAYMVEARSSPLQPSWTVWRRFRSSTLPPPFYCPQMFLSLNFLVWG